jgi:hypothetical protein
VTDFSFYICPKCGYNSKIIGDDLVEEYNRKVIREFLENELKILPICECVYVCECSDSDSKRDYIFTKLKLLQDKREGED